jgi:ribosomal protein S18 acetylase RimI-like enzyme
VDIRPLLPSHADAAVALWRAAGLTRPWNDPYADFATAVAGPSSAVLGAFADSALAGTAMVGHDGHRGWVYYLGVSDRLRRNGIGRALMTAAEEWVRRHGIPKVQLMVRHDNADAVAFYQRLGYADADVVVLGKRL